MSFFQRNQSRQQGPMNVQDALSRLQRDPAAAFQEAGIEMPENLMGNPEAMVMHMIQSGQAGGPILQKIMPAIRQLTGRK